MISTLERLEANEQADRYYLFTEGKAEGRAEGKAEGKKDAMFKIAKRMMRNNRLLQHIIEDTGYTEAELNEIKKQLN